MVLPGLRGPTGHAEGRRDQRLSAAVANRAAAGADVKIDPVDGIGMRGLCKSSAQGECGDKAAA